VTAHDGFTLTDLVSYNDKHNEANLDDNRDGESHNNSWNCGAEGATDDPAILELRARQKRNFLATLLLSQGVPMLLAGDELGRTQQGNNNTYCQDDELSWVDWEHADDELIAFTAQLIGLRQHHHTFRRRRYFQGKGLRGEDLKWLDPGGREMTPEDWLNPHARCVGALFMAAGLDERDQTGKRIVDDDFLLIVNAHYEPIEFQLPEHGWRAVVDTGGSARGDPHRDGRFVSDARSLALLTRASA
jgi:glycogen operon protein